MPYPRPPEVQGVYHAPVRGDELQGDAASGGEAGAVLLSHEVGLLNHVHDPLWVELQQGPLMVDDGPGKDCQTQKKMDKPRAETVPEGKPHEQQRVVA
eukprot:CAMPEP_0173409012 /NCGR_PEP_ID=MMETSP1356-20130122/71142_1 /TAXON_ID=77927 ORGANISM="Hemiselmis virescens, Strain PCC157" /NCGR_SAMPLE_ID=MMETSP1356 /ASSEMBLY_ACC=CAM_ASM_000847 /LENGTH=97 /DNA_ID=CAMNT_0014370401 /DNA_START=494 /DNA_END=787 /DNA_ORIENTATION=+